MVKKIKYRIKILMILIPFANGIKKFLLLNLFINIILMILSFFNPLIYKVFIDDVLLGGSFDRIIFVIVCYLGIFLINCTLGYIKNYLNNRVINATIFKLKLKILKIFLTIPFDKYETTSIGDMKMNIEDDTAYIKIFAENQTINYIISFITASICTIILFFIKWELAIFSISMIPLTFILDHVISKKESILNNSNRDNEQKLSSWLHDSIQGWRETKTLNLEKSQQRQFIYFLNKYALYFSKWINYWVMRVLVTPKIKDEFIMLFCLYFLGGLFVIQGSLKISDLLVFCTYYTMLSDAVNAVSSSDAEVQAATPYIERLICIINNSNTAEQHTKSTPDDSNIILFKNVSFTYPNNNEVLHNINLQINKGDRIAIIGKSGSGKTTLIKLLTGIVQPTKGDIYFSGLNLSSIDISSLHKKIGAVMQENIIFNTSITENLLYAKSDATNDELINACKKACILDYINALPDKFNTIIGEQGIKLSGGQKQRIILARLFLRDVDIFIFDEATSSIDKYNENIINDAIKSINNDKTIIISSHKESSIELCRKKFILS